MLPLFTDNMILHIKLWSLQNQKQLLEQINKLRKVAGYKIKMQKSLVFQYTNNKQSNKEIKNSYI